MLALCKHIKLQDLWFLKEFHGSKTCKNILQRFKEIDTKPKLWKWLLLTATERGHGCSTGVIDFMQVLSFWLSLA